jgi:hypothetical protein
MFYKISRQEKTKKGKKINQDGEKNNQNINI